MPELNDRIKNGILGDIRPNRPPRSTTNEPSGDANSDLENEESMVGGSQHDRTKHSGSRDVTEGTTVGTETGGTRNY
jgi:hypothetical protein